MMFIYQFETEKKLQKFRRCLHTEKKFDILKETKHDY